jgi:hypothetical protein
MHRELMADFKFDAENSTTKRFFRSTMDCYGEPHSKELTLP